MTANLVYLHGFASSPGATKAGLLRDYFEPRGVGVVVPDLNVPSFEQLTLTAMLETTAETIAALPDGPVYLVGSSFGGLAAVHFMDRYRHAAARRVNKLVLLAPVFDLMANRMQHMGETGLATWREQGYLMVPHYAYEGRELPLHYGLVDDIIQYDSYRVRLAIPALIYHGLHDESVEYTQSVRFAEQNPGVELHLLESDHSLFDGIDTIIEGMTTFLNL